MTSPELDTWLSDPSIRVTHDRASAADPATLWKAASELELRDTRLLGRLIGWRIPGLAADTTFSGLFRGAPFAVLAEDEQALISGLVGRIWTLRRDYPLLEEPEEFRSWSRTGTAKVLFAHWVESAGRGRASLRSETRVKAFGTQGRLGLASVRPLIRGFEHLVSTDALATAVRTAERA
jgi:hypothetical protein